jgi:hypothetical protein
LKNIAKAKEAVSKPPGSDPTTQYIGHHTG